MSNDHDENQYEQSEPVEKEESAEAAPEAAEENEAAAESEHPTNVEQTHAVKTDQTRKDLVDRIGQRLSLAMVDLSSFAKALEEAPNTNFNSSEQGRMWMDHLGQASEGYVRDHVFEGSVARESAMWRQSVNNEGEEIAASRPRSKASEGPRELSGDKAVFRLTDKLGLGTVVQIPLWHSGIWVTIRSPKDAVLLELERAIAFDKIDLGRQTYGVAFSNSSVYIAARLINVIIDHVHDSSLKTNSRKLLKKEIDVRDMPTLIWGFLCSIYPNGYPFGQPCTSDVENCQHVTEETILFSKLLWVDNNALNAKQKKHMAERNKKRQHDDLEAYREEHQVPNSRLVELGDDIKAKLEVPSIEQYESAGFKWVEGVVDMVEGAFEVDLNDGDRNRYLLEQGRATSLRQFAHWIKEIHIEDDVAKDRDTVDDMLDRLSSHGTVSDKLLEEINKLIEDSTLSLVAIPQFACPACGGNQTNAHPKYPHLIPIGVMQIFFILLGQRVRSILAG